MFRDADPYLGQWLNHSKRKPLVMRGARQVGKSYLVRKFAHLQAKQLFELNFEQTPELASVFGSKDPHKILKLLAVHFGRDIDPHTALLFLDEVQAAPEILATLRYFYEQKPELPVIAAGSLLEFVLDDHDFSMPVGRIEYLHLEPMNFGEFLRAIGKDKYADLIATYQIGDDLPNFIHQELMTLIKTYCVVGGMPEVVQTFRDKQTVLACTPIQESLLTTYRDDFSKYKTGSINVGCLRVVYQKIPVMTGSKFVYSRVDRDLRHQEIKKSLDLLCKARVVHKVLHSNGNGMPLGAEVEDKDFKVIFLDIGLFCRSLKLDLLGLEQIAELTMVNSGALAEQLVGQLLRSNRELYEEPQLFCWMRQKKSSNAEVDYLLAVDGKVIPIEVKAGKTGTLKSLHFFVREKQSSTAVRFNSDGPSVMLTQTALVGEHVPFNFLSLPFYLASRMPAIVHGLAGQQLERSGTVSEPYANGDHLPPHHIGPRR